MQGKAGSRMEGRPQATNNAVTDMITTFISHIGCFHSKDFHTCIQPITVSQFIQLMYKSGALSPILVSKVVSLISPSLPLSSKGRTHPISGATFPPRLSNRSPR